jgi:hypothetical protein
MKVRRESKLFETADLLYDTEDQYHGGHEGSSKQGGRNEQTATMTTAAREEEYHSTAPENQRPESAPLGRICH